MVHVNCYWAQGQYVGSGGTESPYTYSLSNGTKVAPTTIDGAANAACLYPHATESEISEYGKGLTDRFSHFGFFITLGIWLVYTRFRCKTCAKRFEAKGRNWKAEFDNMKKDRSRRGAEARSEAQDTDAAPSTYQKWKPLVVMLLIGVQVSLGITIGIKINQQTQGLLPATSRNAQIIAESVLNPIDDIFSFLDDILLVKIGVALIAGDYAQMRKVFFLGVFGGAAMGVIGALCSTVLVLVPSLAQAMLNPFGAAAAMDGCHLADNEEIWPASVYFLMTAWAWPFSFASFALSGFAMALNNFEVLAIIGVISNLVYFLGITVLFGNDPRLEVLGYVRFVGTALPTLCWMVYFLIRKDLRVKLGLARQADQDQSLMSQAGPQGAMRDFWSDPETKRAMRDGVLAMLVELTVELGRTITLYVAAKTLGIGGFYQISAHMTIQMETGLAIAAGAMVNMKLQGPQLLGAGLHEHFIWFVEYVYIFALISCLVSALIVYTGHLNLVVGNGSQLSIFASNEACLSDYNAFFGTPTSSLFSETSFVSTILSVPVIVFIRIVYQVARSALYAMQDFLFMVQVSVAAFVVVFLPAVLIMGFTSQSAMVSVVVMSLPNLICGIAFNIRLKSHTDRLTSDEGHKHNLRLQRTNTALGSYGLDPLSGHNGSHSKQPETELSWGSTSDADRITGGPAGSPSVMPPPS